MKDSSQLKVEDTAKHHFPFAHTNHYYVGQVFI